jgi:hypothetical protein
VSKFLSKSSAPALALLALTLLKVSSACAQPHEHYHTNHWVFDGRYHHDHYYPRVGYSVRTLPAGYVVVKYRGGPFYSTVK